MKLTNEKIPKDWDNIEDTKGYKIKESNGMYSGMIVDKNNKPIKLLGMIQSNIGFSYSYKVTKKATESVYNEIMQVLEN